MRDVDVTSGKNQTDFVLLGQLPAKFNAVADFEFCIAVVIESECSRAVPEIKIGVEQKRIFIDHFAFVTALRNFRRQSERATVAEQVAVAKLRPDDSAL